MGVNLYRLKVLLKKHEGYSPKPYVDSVGKLTIGYGRNLDDVGIYADEAELMLENDIEIAIREAYKIFPEFISYKPERQEVIVNMLFNLGATKFLTFARFIEAVKNRDWDKAADEMLDSKWCGQVGNRCFELEKIMREGKYV